MFRFVIGLISGIAIGAASASMSRSQSGQDLRAEFDRIRSDLQQGNFDELGAHLEERFKELQANLEARFAEVEEAAAEMADESLETEEVAEAAAEAAEEAVEEAEEAMEEVRA
jgi:gas vesicle protein